MNFIKNLALACIYIADNIGSNQSLKQEFQTTSTRLMIILKNYSVSIKDMLDKEIKHSLDLIDLGVVDGSVSEINADIFRQGVAKIKAQLTEKTVSKISLAHYFNQSQEAQSISTLEKSQTLESPKINNLHSDLKLAPEVVGSEDLNARDRRQIILASLSRQASGLKELRELIPNTNDKTLQRDLNDLIRDRKVIRLGSKRWAKYYIK